jgi:hypothetical protein
VIFLYLDRFGKWVGGVWQRVYLRQAPARVAGT